MKEKTKRTLKILAGSIIKNDSAIEGAKTAPWWIAVIMFIVCNFLPVIPIMVNANKTYGASFINDYVYGYDQALMGATTELKDSGYKLMVKDHQLLAYESEEDLNNNKPVSEAWALNADQVSKDYTPIASYVSVNDGISTHVLDIYYTDREYGKGAYTVKGLINHLEKEVKYAVNTNNVFNAEVDADYYIPSYLILYKNGIYSKIFKYGTKTAASVTYTGLDWKNTDDMDLLESTLTVENVTPNKYDAKYVSGVFGNWKVIFNTSYKNQKIQTFWATSGIYYGIYLGLGIFMGLMMFLLTRGKRNPNRNLNFWITCKISAWIAFSPAVLAMIVGFFWNAAAGIGYIVLFGLRTMWLSMRQLSPMAQQ